MLTERQKEFQVSRLSQFLTNADFLVWNNPSWPSQHRPDVAFLLSHIVIGGGVSPIVPHPQLRPELLKLSAEALQILTEEDDVKKAAWYDFLGRTLMFSEMSLGFPDLYLSRISYHEAASDLLDRLRMIEPTDYTAFQAERVSDFLSRGFQETKRPTLSQTTIEKTGFIELIKVGEFDVAYLYGREIEYVDEIYPTIFEIITEQIMTRRGDIGAFDRDARSGYLNMSAEEDHSRFAQILFRAMKYVDWRAILDAFKTGNLEDMLTILKENEHVPGFGDEIFLKLFKAMQEDEAWVMEVNLQTSKRGQP